MFNFSDFDLLECIVASECETDTMTLCEFIELKKNDVLTPYQVIALVHDLLARGEHMLERNDETSEKVTLKSYSLLSDRGD